MSKKYAIFITCLFAAFLGVFAVANAVTPTKEFSPMENRALAQMPELTVDSLSTGTFMSGFESFVTDQFILRDEWIALKAGAEYASGKRENNGVYICDEHTLIARFDPPANDRAKKRIDDNFGYVEKLSTLTDKPVYFSLIPGKVSVWADLLPDGAPNDDEGQYIARGAALQGPKWLDTDTALNAHKDEAIYYRTDHHWTTLGAYYAYASLMEGMGRTPKALSEFDPTVVSDEFFGTTFSSSGVRWLEPDSIEFYVPQSAATVTNYFDDNPTAGQLYDMSKLAEKDKYAAFLGGNKPLTVVKSNVAPEAAPKLMLIRDSYADSLAPFLCYHFSEIHLVDPRYYKTSMAQYVKDNAIDEVLVLYSVSNFVKDGNLFVLGMAAK